jgi:hypothetical protein
MLLLLVLWAALASSAAYNEQIPDIKAHGDASATGTASGGSINPHKRASSSSMELRLVVLALLSTSNSPALDLMGVVSHLQARYASCF